MAKKHPGYDGDWCLDSADPNPMSIRERLNTLLTPPDPQVIKVMQDEEAFLRQVKPFTTKRFTDRRPIPGRDRLIP
jgi:hypothetical protein